jgi:DNA-binding CsgD family transcriptional regulator
LREALDSAPGPVERAVAALDLGRTLTVTERLAEATEVLEEAAAGLGEGGGPLALALEAALIAAANLDGTLRTLARERVRRIDPALEPRGLAECMLLSLLAVEHALQGESAEQTAAIGERALVGGWLVNGEPMTLGYVASALSFAGRLERSATVLGEGIDAARARGAPLAVAVLAGMRSHVQLVAGRVADAEADARTSLDLAAAHGPHPSLAFASAFLADALLEHGDLADAEAAVGDGFRIPRVERQYGYLRLLDARGRLRLEQGRLREALEDFLECGRRHADWGGYNPALVQWQGHAALAHAALGEPERATELARDDERRARRFGAPWLVGATLRLLAAVEAPTRRAVLLREALTKLDGSEAALERARVLVDLGAAVLERDGPEAAREPLRTALDAAVRCGASALAERARTDLHAAGGRPRRAALSGEAALTAGERRIARLAAGMTNREIAEAEFVTVKTVEFHLHNAYRKLGVAGRHELDTALGRDANSA